LAAGLIAPRESVADGLKTQLVNSGIGPTMQANLQGQTVRLTAETGDAVLMWRLLEPHQGRNNQCHTKDY
jgi:hypothetical protein